MNIVELDQAIKAVCPIDGVSIGKPDDKATWRIDFQEAATKEQRAAAQGIIAGVKAIDPPKAITALDMVLADPQAEAKLKAALGL